MGAEGERHRRRTAREQASVGGWIYGKLVAAYCGLVSESLATWSDAPRRHHDAGFGRFFFIFPTRRCSSVLGRDDSRQRAELLWALGMQVAFVLPLSMPLFSAGWPL